MSNQMTGPKYCHRSIAVYNPIREAWNLYAEQHPTVTFNQTVNRLLEEFLRNEGMLPCVTDAPISTIRSGM